MRLFADAHTREIAILARVHLFVDGLHVQLQQVGIDTHIGIHFHIVVAVGIEAGLWRFGGAFLAEQRCITGAQLQQYLVRLGNKGNIYRIGQDGEIVAAGAAGPFAEEAAGGFDLALCAFKSYRTLAITIAAAAAVLTGEVGAGVFYTGVEQHHTGDRKKAEDSNEYGFPVFHITL